MLNLKGTGAQSLQTTDVETEAQKSYVTPYWQRQGQDPAQCTCLPLGNDRYLERELGQLSIPPVFVERNNNFVFHEF